MTDLVSPLDQILTTKLFIPGAAHALVERARLFALLERGRECRLTIVSAPAGFGKTTLVADWLRQRPPGAPAPVWLSLDPEDAAPVRFWTYVLHGLERASPGLGRPLLPYLQPERMPPIERTLTLLINALLTIPAPLTLVLDDYHLIDAPAVHRSLTFLIEHLPAQLRVVLLTRADPPLPLTRLRAQGQLHELRTDQLRCSDTETSDLLSTVFGVQLAPPSLAQVNARTEGWMAGLQLLGLSLQGAANPDEVLADLDGSHHDIIDYLTEEVLRGQPSAIREFLLRTAVLDQLCAPLCDALLRDGPAPLGGASAAGGSAQMLVALERANLFLTPLDPHRRWYRYHALFAEALRQRLRQEHPELEAELHRRASAWLAGSGREVEATRHALLAGDWPRAAELIEPLTRMSTWREGELAATERWLGQLPAVVVRGRPQLCATYARLYTLSERPAMAISWLDAADVALSKAEDQGGRGGARLRGEQAARRAMLAAVYLERPEEALALCAQARALLAPEDHYQHALVDLAGGPAHLALGDASAAAGCLLAAASHAERAGNLGAALINMGQAAACLQLCGRPADAEALSARAGRLGVGGEGLRYPGLGIVLAYRADLLRERGQLDAALDLALEGVELGRQTGYPLYIDGAQIVLARICLALGRLDQAEAALDKAECGRGEVASAYLHPWRPGPERVRLWLARGEIARAARWASEMRAGPSARAPYGRQRDDVALARVLLAQSRADAALDTVESLLARADADGRVDHVIELRVLRALALQQRGDQSGAVGAAAAAVELGLSRGYLQSFREAGAPFARLLTQLASARPAPQLTMLLAALRAGEPAPAAPDRHETPRAPAPPRAAGRQLVEPLSERELEVLRLVAVGASNQEIAGALTIALNTVKRHVGNICGKLGATNRTQAVAYARGLDLLPDYAEVL